MLAAHPELFIKHDDKEYLALTTFLMYESCRGSDSFWSAYLRTMGSPDLPYHWSDEELNQLRDPVLKEEVRYYGG